jgi:alanyl-tRNA synthetase
VLAVTGSEAIARLFQRSDLVDTLADRLETPPDPTAIAQRVNQLQDDLTEARRQLAQLQRGQAREVAAQLAASPVHVREVPVVAAAVSVADDRALRDLGDAIRSRLGSGVIVLAAEVGGQARFIVTVDEGLTKRGVAANKIAQAVGERLGGKGGGRPESAQGGGKETGRLHEAVAGVPDLVAAQVG